MPQLDPKRQISPDVILDNPADFPDERPTQISKTDKNYYAIQKQLADGTIQYEWYRRNNPDAQGNDQIIARTQGFSQKIADESAKAATAEGVPIGSRTVKDPQGNVTKVTVHQRPDGSTYEATDVVSDQSVGQVEQTEGTPDPSKPGGMDNERPRMVTRDAQNTIIKVAPLSGDQQKVWQESRERSRNPGGMTDAEVLARTKALAPTPIASTFGKDAAKAGIVNADGSITWIDNPNRDQTGTPINLPPTQRNAIWQMPDGSIKVEKNPNYKPPSQIAFDATGRARQITEDEQGNPIIRDVPTEHTIRPSQLPVLQARYGEIATGLGQLAADLNQQLANGEITPEEREQAFTAAHQQAQAQISEINSILSNSRETWAQQIAQRNNIYGEAASRRSYAASIMNNAVTEGGRVAESSGPGHGAAIAQGVAALMRMGQNYAGGMGGLPSMDEIPTPRALQQQQDVDLPGFGASTIPKVAPTGGGMTNLAPAAAARTSAVSSSISTLLNRPPVAAPAAPAPAGLAPVSPPKPVFTPAPPTNVQPTTLPLAPPPALTPRAYDAQPGAPAFGTAPAPPAGTTTPYPATSPDVVNATTSTSDNLISNLLRPDPTTGAAPSAPQPAATSPWIDPATGQYRDPFLRAGSSILGGLGAALGGMLTPNGLPVAAGGGGWFDPHAEASSMIGDGSDPGWAAAVKQALLGGWR